MKKKKVVVIGGGTGTYQVLTGLKKYPNFELSAIISMCDSGGSTGRLRRELGILPPGDVRRAILALSDVPFGQKTLEELFDFRFANGESLKGHSVGNILLAALSQITGSMDKAILEAARILNTSGNIYPVTLDDTNLVARLFDGTCVYGETNIDMRDVKPKVPIKNVYLNPKAKIFSGAAKAIKEADLITIGPGDLYTSIIPALLVNGVSLAIKRSKGKVVYVVNLMTKRGETDNYKASDFIARIKEYLGEAAGKLKYVVVNKKINHETGKARVWYKHYGCIPVADDLSGNDGYRVIKGNFVGATTLFRHDPDKLAKAIAGLLL